MSLSFPKSARLARADEFARLKREGVTHAGRYMVLSVLRDITPGGPARIGIITSRRVGGAVERNRTRRRLRELFRHSRPALCDGVWIVAIARQHAAKASFQALEAEWNKLVRRGGLLRAEC